MMQKQIHQLQTAFGFSLDDLAENRMGRLSAAQKATMRRGALQLLIIALLFLTAIATLIIVFAGPADRDIQLITIGLIALVAFILIDTVGSTESAIMPGIVARASGVLYVSNDECYVAPLDHPFITRNEHGNYAWSSSYMEGEQFRLTKAQCKMLPQGALVDVYYIPAMRKVVSVDIIKTQDSDDLSIADVPLINRSMPRLIRDDIDDVEPLLG